MKKRGKYCNCKAAKHNSCNSNQTSSTLQFVNFLLLSSAPHASITNRKKRMHKPMRAHVANIISLTSGQTSSYMDQ
jgi:hypothetical protein